MIPAFLLVVLCLAWRLATGLLIHSGATWLSNFAPCAALALCGGAVFPTRFKFTVPLLGLLATDIILNAHYQAPLFTPLMLCRYLTLALICLFGLCLQNRVSLKAMLPASLVASSVFYVITCVFAWLSDPGYVKNAAGLLQSLTVGLTSYAATPSWMFFRNSLVSDLAFTFVFVLCLHFSRAPGLTRSRAALPHPA